jgi:hypothetical protein
MLFYRAKHIKFYKSGENIMAYDREIRTDIDPGMAAFFVDNLLMNIQFSYACDYYGERYKIYAGEDIFQKDEFVVENILRFIKAALKLN